MLICVFRLNEGENYLSEYDPKKLVCSSEFISLKRECDTEFFKLKNGKYAVIPW